MIVLTDHGVFETLGIIGRVQNTVKPRNDE